MSKKEETASFVLRFNQKIFQSEQGEAQVQWRGNIRHVQDGDEKRFSEFEDVVNFIQTKLADLTIQAMEDKSPEEQKGILSKSFDLWKRMAVTYPKMVGDIIKDPKAGVEQIQEQIQEQVQEQVSQVSDMINTKLSPLAPENWKPASKADFHEVMKTLSQLSGQITTLTQKVEELSKK